MPIHTQSMMIASEHGTHAIVYRDGLLTRDECLTLAAKLMYHCAARPEEMYPLVLNEHHIWLEQLNPEPTAGSSGPNAEAHSSTSGAESAGANGSPNQQDTPS